MNGGRNNLPGFLAGKESPTKGPALDMARNSRIDDREPETELASAGGGIVVLLVLAAIIGIVKWAGWL